MTRIQLRRDTAANWTANNPVLAAGEPAYETDTGKFKIGDGSKTYTALPYKGEGGGSGGGAEIDDTTTSTDKVWSSSKTNSEIQNVAGEVVDIQADVADLDSLTSTLSTDVAGLKTTTTNLNTSVDALNTDVTNIGDTEVITSCYVSTDGKKLNVSKKKLGETDPLQTSTASYTLQKLTAGENITIEGDVISATGGSTPDNMVTTNTNQTIGGVKTFKNDIIINQWASSPTVREAHIDMSNGNQTQFISADGTNKEFGLYSNSTTGIRINSNKNTLTCGLLVQPSALTFTSSDGTTTDLLAGGGGATYTAGNNINISADNVIKLADQPSIYSATFTNHLSTKSIYLGDTTERNYPRLTYNSSNGINLQGFNFVGTDTVLKPITVVGESLKFGDRTNQYDVITKNPTDNEYMAHMAMPSDKYIDLELGASGSTYTAPADGWFHIRKKATVAGKYISAGVDGLYYLTTVSVTTNQTFGLLFPVKKGETLKVTYSADGDTVYFRFIYAVGSEPVS